MKQKLLNILYRFYAFFTRIYLKRTGVKIIGITGSVGKTSCRMIIYQVLQKYLPDKKIYSSPKNYNSEIGLVMSIFGIENYTPSVKNLLKLFFSLFFRSLFQKKKADILVLEYGVDKPNDMDFLLKVAVPDYAIFTMLDYVHSENFISKEELGKEKMKLLQSAKKGIFLNYLDDFQREYSEFLEKKKYFYNNREIEYKYGVKEKQIISNIKIGDKTIQTNILGKESAIYIDLAFEIFDFFRKDEIIIKDDFLELQNLNGRFSVFDGKNDSILVDSSYNAGFESMKAMIENTADLRNDVFLDKEIIFVLGDMRETGNNTKSLHRRLFEFAKDKGKIISVGKETAVYFGKHLGNFKYAKHAGVFLRDYLKKSESEYIVLFKGGQNTIFLEEALKEVLRYKKDEKNLVRQESYWKKENF